VGAPASTSSLSLDATGTPGEVDVTRNGGDDDVITSTCTETSPTSYTCAGVTATYTVTVSFSSPSRFPSNGKLKVQATFRGNEVLKSRKSSQRTAGTK
jgi:hypothetical protein